MRPATIAIDSCAALHAKQLELLHVLDHFAAAGVDFILATSVYGEAVEMSLSAWLDKHAVEAVSVRRNRVKAMRNHCRPRRLPGRKDLELVAAAHERDAVLLSHDDKAAEAGRRAKLLVVDLVDLVGFAHEQSWIDDDDVDAASESFAGFTKKAPDWVGDVHSTLQGRTGYRQCGNELRKRLGL